MIEDGAVVHELVLRTPPAQVFAFFVEPDKLIRWIGLSAELDPRPGGVFRFEIVPGEHCEGSYVEVDPPRRLVFTWGWSNSFPALAVRALDPSARSRAARAEDPFGSATNDLGTPRRSSGQRSERRQVAQLALLESPPRGVRPTLMLALRDDGFPQLSPTALREQAVPPRFPHVQ